MNPELERLRRLVRVDAGECKVLEHIPPARPRSLLAALMVRAGALAPLPPTQAKRGRGRPPKSPAGGLCKASEASERGIGGIAPDIAAKRRNGLKKAVER
jgi:hypothetical protein